MKVPRHYFRRIDWKKLVLLKKNFVFKAILNWIFWKLCVFALLKRLQDLKKSIIQKSIDITWKLKSSMVIQSSVFPAYRQAGVFGHPSPVLGLLSSVHFQRSPFSLLPSQKNYVLNISGSKSRVIKPKRYLDLDCYHRCPFFCFWVRFLDQRHPNSLF